MDKKKSNRKFKDFKITVKVENGNTGREVRELTIGEAKPKPLDFNQLPKHSSAGLDALDRLRSSLYLTENEKVEVQVIVLALCSIYRHFCKKEVLFPLDWDSNL